MHAMYAVVSRTLHWFVDALVRGGFAYLVKACRAREQVGDLRCRLFTRQIVLLANLYAWLGRMDRHARTHTDRQRVCSWVSLSTGMLQMVVYFDVC